MSQINLTKAQLSDWKQELVTKKVFEILVQEKLALAMAAVESPVPQEQLLMYRGKVECINSILEGDMFEPYLVRDGDETS